MKNYKNFKFKKRYGQNFIVDSKILKKIVSLSNIDNDTLVIEIGVGSGNLTTFLTTVASWVIGYEIDLELKPILDKKFINKKNIKIIYDDFLKRDIKEDITNYKYKKIYLISNLPYYITTPIINKIINDNISVDKMIIMVQKEVGERLNAKINSRSYNSLTVFVNYNYEIKKLFNVSKKVFIPQPKVDSVVLELIKKERKEKCLDENVFFKLVKDSFKYKRKNLRNNLKHYNLDIIKKVLDKYNLDLTIRAEGITLDQFIEIANEIKYYR